MQGKPTLGFGGCLYLEQRGALAFAAFQLDLDIYVTDVGIITYVDFDLYFGGALDPWVPNRNAVRIYSSTGGIIAVFKEAHYGSTPEVATGDFHVQVKCALNGRGRVYRNHKGVLCKCRPGANNS